MTNLGEHSLDLLQAQSSKLDKGTLIRVRQSGGNWCTLRVYSKHKQNWFNVSSPKASFPSHSLRLLPGGRWYIVPAIDEIRPDLEVDDLHDPMEADTLPVDENNLLNIQDSHPMKKTDLKEDMPAVATSKCKPSILPSVPTEPWGAQLEVHNDIDNSDIFNLEGNCTIRQDQIGFNHETADFISNQFITMIGIEDVATHIRLIADWHSQFATQQQPSYEDQMRFSTKGRNLLEEFQKACSILAMQNPENHTQLTELKYLINQIVRDLLERPITNQIDQESSTETNQVAVPNDQLRPIVPSGQELEKMGISSNDSSSNTTSSQELIQDRPLSREETYRPIDLMSTPVPNGQDTPCLAFQPPHHLLEAIFPLMTNTRPSLTDSQLASQRMRWDQTVDRLKAQKGDDRMLIEKIQAKHEQDIVELKQAMGGLKMQNKVEQNDIRSNIEPLGAQVANINRCIEAQDIRYEDLAKEIKSFGSTTAQLRTHFDDLSRLDSQWKSKFEREFHANLATIVDSLSNLRKSIEEEAKPLDRLTKNKALETIADRKNQPAKSDHHFNEPDPQSPLEGNIQQMGNGNMDPLVQGCIDDLNEMNDRLLSLYRQGRKALDSDQDGAIKEVHMTLNHRLDKLHSNTQQVRRNYKQTVRIQLLPKDVSDALQHESLKTNQHLMKELDALATEISEEVSIRGLSLSPTALAKSIKVEFTTFCGTSLPLVHEFLEESKKVMAQSGVPLSTRGAALLNTLKGPAKIMVMNSDLPRNPSFDQIADVLKSHFGQIGFLTNQLQRLHSEHGRIPPPYDPEQPVFEIFNITKEHMRLIKAAQYLQDLYLEGKIPENIVNSPYLNLLEEILPGEQQARLSELPGYNTKMTTVERFNVLMDAFAKLSGFASAKIAKFGIKEDSKTSKRKKHNIPALTSIETPSSKGEEEYQNGKQKTIRFKENIPMVALPLPPPKPRMNPVQAICYNCHQRGHFSSNCPSKTTYTAVKANSSQTVRDPKESITMTPYGSSRYLVGRTTCYICIRISQIQGTELLPRNHLFTQVMRRLYRTSCPAITDLPTIEERLTLLRNANVCPACLTGQLDDEQHRNQPCNITIKFPNFKCTDLNCYRRFDLCTQHMDLNKVRLQVLRNELPKIAPRAPSLITASLPTDNRRPTPALYSNNQALLKEPGLTLQDLIKKSTTPIMKASETPVHFMLQMIPSKQGAKPTLCVYDTGSLSTLATHHTLCHKLHSSPNQGPDTTIQGLGGLMPANPHFVSLPLQPTEASGYSSKITPCLAVSKIISIQTIDINGVTEYLHQDYGHLLPADFHLYNYAQLGSSVEVDMLLGLQDLAVFPKLLFSTNCGLHVFKSPIAAAEGTSCYLIAGTLPTNIRGELSDDDPGAEVVCASTHLQNNLNELEFLNEVSADNVDQLYEELQLIGQSLSLYGKVDDDPVPHTRHPEPTCITAKGYCTKELKPTPNKQLGDILNIDQSIFRCISCQQCQNCSQTRPPAGVMSLKEEIENEMIKNSVTLDIKSHRLVAKLVLPANYLELLGDNKMLCLSRLRKQLKKLSLRDEVEKQQVKDSIEKLIRRGFVSLKRDLTPEEITIIEQHESPYYLPTAIVFKSASLSSPSRVCLDASAKSPTGYSLNDLLPKGSQSMRVGDLIHHWKSFPVAASGDMSSYFCRFRLSPEYWPLQKFLWIPNLDPNGEAEEFFVKTVIFGVKSSSLICEMGLQKLIHTFPHLQKLTAYVDDLTLGFYNTETAEKTTKEIANTLDTYGLPLKGAAFAITGRPSPKEIMDEDGTLGISCVRWNPLDDTFTCNVPKLFVGQVERGSLANVKTCPHEDPLEINQWLPNDFTLRDLLSKTASHFDGRMGLVSSLTVKLRKLIRDLSIMSRDENHETNWSYVVPLKERMIFCTQLSELIQLGKFRFPRFPAQRVSINEEKETLLLCFTDSGDFESIAIYLAYELEDGQFLFNYLTAASYLKADSETVPRSELNAASRGAKIVREVLDGMKDKLKLSPFLFTDSLVSLHWTVNYDSYLHIYHRNRVSTILSVFGSNLFHVRSAFNPADIISRENTSAKDISPTSQFYNGPKWLEQGFDLAVRQDIITPATSLTNIAPDLLDSFRSGVILSKYVDHNFLTLKKRIEKETQEDNKYSKLKKTTKHEQNLTDLTSQPDLKDTTILCVSNTSPHATTAVQKLNALIVSANYTSQRDSGANEANLDSPQAITLMNTVERKTHLSKQLDINYFINPQYKNFPRICRVGGIVLQFIQLLLEKTLKRNKPAKYELMRKSLFFRPPATWDVPCLIVSAVASKGNQNSSKANNNSGDKPPPHDLSAKNQLNQIRKTWYRYPGINHLLKLIVGMLDSQAPQSKGGTDLSNSKSLMQIEQLLLAWQSTTARLSVQELSTRIQHLLITHNIIPKKNRQTQTSIGTKNGPQHQSDTIFPRMPNDHCFMTIFNHSHETASRMSTLSFLHLIRAEQKTLPMTWGKTTLCKRGVWKDGFWLNNTRWRESVGSSTGEFSQDPDLMDFSSFIQSISVPLLDWKNPLYQSLSHFIHHQYRLPTISEGLLKKHRGVSQDHALALKFAFAPAGIKAFKQIRDNCMICQLRLKKLMKTQEGNLPLSRLTFVKPFHITHIDLAGPILIRSHHTTSTRRRPNRTKVWILVSVCSWTRAIQAELMTGTSASDVADGLTRVMSVVGSISHIVTDQLASQLKVVREGKFLEQVQQRLYQRVGFSSTVVPVSRHNTNGTAEVRIRSLKQMLSLKNNQSDLTILEFSTQVKLATNLMNSTPYAFSLKGAEQHPQLHLISPASFLFPLQQLHRPVLSPVMLVNSPQHYFTAMKEYYLSMVNTYVENIVPVISAKNHNYSESENPTLAVDDIVLFKKRPTNNHLLGWSLGRVSEINISRDKVVRSVKLVYPLTVGKIDEEVDPLVETTPQSRFHYDRNLYKVYTTRQVDELIKLFPIGSEEINHTHI